MRPASVLPIQPTVTYNPKMERQHRRASAWPYRVMAALGVVYLLLAAWSLAGTRPMMATWHLYQAAAWVVSGVASLFSARVLRKRVRRIDELSH